MINPKRHDPWYRHAVLYQIYPLSWADTNGDGFGDLRGIISHLDYLNDQASESLGVGAIWLSPVYRSGMADWGYDVIDHCAIDPRFGTMADFEELVRQVHDRGMRLLMDFVPNHTSSQHAWFEEARASHINARRDWYIWADPRPDGSLPNNWLSRFGGPAWTLDEATGQYYLHTFLAEQPDLNWRNPQVRAAMEEVLRFWLRRGVDGFRADAVSSLLKDPSFQDDPPNPDYRPSISDPADANLRVHSSMRTGLPDVLGAVCDVLAAQEDHLLLSEAYLDLPGLQELYGACGDHPGLHAPFNFNLLGLPWSVAAYQGFIEEYEGVLGPDDWPNYVLGNHDQPRLVSRVGPERARLLGFMQLTLRGLPVIYYGEELGMRGGVAVPATIRDTWEQRRPGRHFNRDEARTPMPWRDEPGVGFTEGEAWLNPAPGSETINVQAEEYNPDSMLQLYRQLIHLRATSPGLADGTYRSIESNNDQVMVYAREAPRGKCYILLNFASTPQSVTLRQIGQWIAGTHQLHGDGKTHMLGKIELAPYEGRLYEIKRGVSNHASTI